AKRALVDGKLLSGDALAELQAVTREIAAERRQSAEVAIRAIEAELANVEQQIAHLVDAVAQVGISAALTERLAAAERRRDELKRQATMAAAAARVDLS